MADLITWLNAPLFSVWGSDFTAGKLLAVPFTLLCAWFVYRLVVQLVTRRLESHNVNPDVIHLLQRIILIVFLLLVIFSVLELLNVPLAAFAFLSGAIAIGFGFGAQNVINNFISGWILMWERPIRIGDFLEIGDVKGTVESINTRSTRIKRVDGVHMLIPNSYLLENIVVNWTLVDRLVRTTVTVGVAYGSPVEQVRDVLTGIATASPDVLDDPQPLVLFEDFGDSSLVFSVVFWVMAKGERDLRVVRSDLRYEITRQFSEHGIVIAFPQRDLHLNSAVPLEVRMVPGHDS